MHRRELSSQTFPRAPGKPPRSSCRDALSNPPCKRVSFRSTAAPPPASTSRRRPPRLVYMLSRLCGKPGISGVGFPLGRARRPALRQHSSLTQVPAPAAPASAAPAAAIFCSAAATAPYAPPAAAPPAALSTASLHLQSFTLFGASATKTTKPSSRSHGLGSGGGSGDGGFEGFGRGGGGGFAIAPTPPSLLRCARALTAPVAARYYRGRDHPPDFFNSLLISTPLFPRFSFVPESFEVPVNESCLLC